MIKAILLEEINSKKQYIPCPKENLKMWLTKRMITTKLLSKPLTSWLNCYSEKD
jgi:hypothetical protein